MTTADTGALEESDGIHTTLAALEGQMLLGVGAPIGGKDVFAERVLRAAADDSRDTLHVAAARSPSRFDALPDETKLVDCSPSPRPTDGRCHSVSSPGDLTGIGMPVSSFLEHAAPRPVVTLDSISTLLMYADESAVFRFFAVLTAQLRQGDGVGLFFLEAGCHDTKTVKTFQQLFDGRVDIEADRVRLRGVDGVSPSWVPR